MKTKYINKTTYIFIIGLTLMCLACLESNDLNNVLTQTPETTEPVVETLPAGEGLAIGATAPAFSLPDADGNYHSLSEYVGQTIVIVFYRGGW